MPSTQPERPVMPSDSEVDQRMGTPADVRSRKSPKTEIVKVDYKKSGEVPEWIREVIEAGLAIEREDARSAGSMGFMTRALVSLELFRVQNVAMSQTFFQRIAGVGDVTLVTQDQTNPFVSLIGMQRPEQLRDWLNEYVMRQRRARGFQEIVVN